MESNDREEKVVPISARITNERDNSRVYVHFFDFDSRLRRQRFDLSECFEGKDKVYFGIRFEYGKEIGEIL